MNTLLVLFALLVLCLQTATAQQNGNKDQEPLTLRLVSDWNSASVDENYSYRARTNARTIAVMLYGFDDNSTRNGNRPTSILKDRKALTGFFKQHWDTVKRDYLGQNGNQRMQLSAGDDAFTSTSINRSTDFAPAKLAGLSIPIGRVTLGGGYTWGEKNPAMMLRKTDGLIAGVAYERKKMGFQFSYLATGQEIAGFQIGGGNVRYDSMMFGTSWRVNDRIGMTALIQYRRDNDPLTTGDTQTIVTIGTRWKF